jgi:hypothetical protein
LPLFEKQGDYEAFERVLAETQEPEKLAIYAYRTWLNYMNEAHSASEQDAIHRCVVRGTPYGSESWVTQSATHLQLKRRS